ncbi:formin-like protein 2 [Triticum aestivum]|nr:formin-like protein 2 [Triticum aestivum]
MFAMYRQGNNDVVFKYLHVYKRIDKCEKWAEVRRTLDKAKETYKPDAPTSGASEGRPDGNKGAKNGKHADAATARVQESIEHCLADAQARATLREEKTGARWSALLSSSAVKIDLLRTNVVAKKRNTDLAFLLGGADMLQSNDEAVKAWYLAERGLILNQLPSTTTPTPTLPPSPSDDAAETPRSTEATPTPPSTETPPSPRTPTPPTPEVDLAI